MAVTGGSKNKEVRMGGRKNDRADFSNEVFNQCLEHFKMDEDLMVNLKAAIVYLEHYKIIHTF
jgi:hemerythrin